MYDASVNSIAWAAQEVGLVLAAASSDGKITIIEYRNDSWTQTSFVNDSMGCNAVSWAPFTALGSASSDASSSASPVLRLVTGSCDNTVRIWRFEGQFDRNKAGQWVEERRLAGGHTGNTTPSCLCDDSYS